MADANEPLSTYLDGLIRDLYVRHKFSGVALFSPSGEEFREYIEDEDVGRPHPIDDAADHYLLRAFDSVRRDLASLPPPVNNGFFGEVRGRYGTWVDGDLRVTPKSQPRYANEITGEIPWRCFHGDPDWPCMECGHHPDKHHGTDLCTEGAYLDEKARICYPCNCGNNCGR